MIELSKFNNIDAAKFYKASEFNHLIFYRVPKVFLANKTVYKNLGLTEHYIYSILQDRFELSMKNNWVDENGNIYMIWDREKLAEFLGISRKTASKYISELEKFGLLVDRRNGQGKPNWLYLLKPEAEEIDFYTPGSVGNTLTGQNDTSRSDISTQQDESKVPTNDTNLNNTNLSNTFIPSLKLSTEEKEDSIDNIKENERVNENSTVNEFNAILKQSGYDDFEEEYSTAIEQSIRILYYSDKPLAINGMRVPCGQVREDLQRLRWEHIDLALRDFKIASEHQQINNVTAYLSRCIYNAIFNSSLKVEADLRYNGLI